MGIESPATGEPALDRLYEDVAAADLQPLWLLRGLLPTSPNGLTPHAWRWRTLRDLARRSGELVGIERGGDRRVLSLSHPSLGGLPFATHTLWGGIQYLNPGELAPAHRHSPAALRFVLEGSGVWTLVNGDPIVMEPGDLVLTPSWSWHEHRSAGDAPMIWFDGLDLPLVRNLDAVFFEEGSGQLSAHHPTIRSRSEAAHGVAGIRPTHVRSIAQPPASGRHSSLLAYRWADVDRTLSHLATQPHQGSVAVRYVDPLSGEDVMPTLRAEMHRVLPGTRTLSVRSVGSQLCVVWRGSGRSVIAGQQFDWEAGDMFVVPSWAAVDHECEDAADLFVISDHPIIEAAGLGRREELATHQTLGAGLDQFPVSTGPSS